MKRWQIFSTRQHNVLMWFMLSGLTLLAVVLSMTTGTVAITPGQVIGALLGKGTDTVAARIVLFSRLPRTCAALLAGSGLAVAGVVIQTVLSNPLASPGVIGANSGAGLAVAVVCAVAPALQQFTPLIAFAGAFLSVFMVMTLSRITSASRMTVVLAGIAVSNLFSAGIDAVVTVVPDALNGVTDFRIGGFSGTTMEQLTPAAVIIGIGILLVLSLARQMDILALGSDVAQSLGMCVGAVRFVLLILATALTGAVVSFSGLLGFVGLIVPHAMRRVVGEESTWLVMASALGGACFVTLCDLLARVLFAPYELPVGIVLAFAGCPFFLWLLFRRRGGRQ